MIPESSVADVVEAAMGALDGAEAPGGEPTASAETSLTPAAEGETPTAETAQAAPVAPVDERTGREKALVAGLVERGVTLEQLDSFIADYQHLQTQEGRAEFAAKNFDASAFLDALVADKKSAAQLIQLARQKHGDALQEEEDEYADDPRLGKIVNAFRSEIQGLKSQLAKQEPVIKETAGSIQREREWNAWGSEIKQLTAVSPVPEDLRAHVMEDLTRQLERHPEDFRARGAVRAEVVRLVKHYRVLRPAGRPTAAPTVNGTSTAATVAGPSEDLTNAKHEDLVAAAMRHLDKTA